MHLATALGLLAVLSAAPMTADGQSPAPSSVPAPDPAAKPCLDSPARRALDFWVGEWEVRGANRPEAPPARSKVDRVEDGCVIYERFESPTGYSGRSFNSYNPTKDRWEQFWVDNKGEIHHYVGQARDGNMFCRAESVPLQGASQPGTVRMTFFNLGADKVRQLGEQSTDGGRTWTTMYDLAYTRVK